MNASASSEDATLWTLERPSCKGAGVSFCGELCGNLVLLRSTCNTWRTDRYGTVGLSPYYSRRYRCTCARPAHPVQPYR